MPESTSGVYYPAGSQTPATAADWRHMLDDLDPMITAIVTDAGERNTRLLDSPAGKKAVTPDGWEWVKVSPSGQNVWRTLHSDETFTGFTWQPNFADSGNSLIYRDGPNYDLFIEAVYSGPDLAASSGGNLTDVTMCTIADTTWRPRRHRTVWFQPASAAFPGAGGTIYQTGGVQLQSAMPGTVLTDGTTLRVSATWVRIADAEQAVTS